MKIIIILVIISGLVAAGFKARAMAVQSGFDAAEIEFRAQMDDIRVEAAAQAIEDWKLAQDIAGESTDVEIQIVEKIRYIEREIPKIIEKIVEIRPECSDLPELGVLFSQQAEASNNRQDSDIEDTGQSETVM